MQAWKLPTPGTNRPSAASAASRVGGERDVGPDVLERPHGTADVAAAVVEDDDRRAHRRPPRSSAVSARWARLLRHQPVEGQHAAQRRLDVAGALGVAAHEQVAPGQAEQAEHGDEQVERGAVARAEHVGERLLADPALGPGRGQQHRQAQRGQLRGLRPRRAAAPRPASGCAARGPVGCTVRAARPWTSKNPIVGRARHGAGRAASTSMPTSYGAALRARSSARVMPVHGPNGATVTATSPRRSQRVTAPGRPSHEHQPVPGAARPHVGSHGLERTLRARDPLDAGVAGHGRPQRPGERLELGLDDVVRVATGEHAHVQGDLGVERERLEHVPGQRADVVARR